MRVEADAVTIEVDGIRLVSDIALSAVSGTVVALVGPNGSGKSSFLRGVYRSLRPRSGRIWLGDADAWELSARDAAQRTAVVLQDDSPEFEFTVRELVELGRVPYRRVLGRPTPTDRTAVDDALVRAGVAELADRYLATLSGGERQRVFLARALAQRTPILLLDEPTNHLDIRAQVELLELLVALPATVIVALHDLNLAASYCDAVVVLAGGRVVASGPPREVLNPELIETTYGVRAEVGTNRLTGRPVLHFGAPVRPGPLSEMTTEITTETESSPT